MSPARPFLPALIAFMLLLGASVNVWAQQVPSVSLEAARTALETSSHVVFDIREASEHAAGVAKGARLLPMSQLGKRLAELPGPDKQPFLIICNTQNRSARVVEQLRASGYTNASYVQGGMKLWAERGWTMVKPPAESGPPHSKPH